jgi:hypothetical protein
MQHYRINQCFGSANSSYGIRSDSADMQILMKDADADPDPDPDPGGHGSGSYFAFFAAIEKYLL